MLFGLQDSRLANSIGLTRFFKKLFHNVSCIAHRIVGSSASTGVTHRSDLLKLYASLLLKRLSLVVNTLKQRVEGIYELLHPLLLQLLSDLVIVDPDVRECSKLRLRL